MSELAWSSHILRNHIAPVAEGKNIGSRIRDCAIALRWKISRVNSVWYEDERTSIKPKELREIEHLSGLKYGQEEVSELDALITRADTLLNGTDADFHSAFFDAVREVARTAYRAGAKK